MSQILFYIMMLLPPFLAFGLVAVSEPRWVGVLMWLVSAGIAIGFWYWASGANDPGGRIIAYSVATYMSLPVLVALSVRFLGRTSVRSDRSKYK